MPDASSHLLTFRAEFLELCCLYDNSLEALLPWVIWRARAALLSSVFTLEPASVVPGLCLLYLSTEESSTLCRIGSRRDTRSLEDPC